MINIKKYLQFAGWLIAGGVIGFMLAIVSREPEIVHVENYTDEEVEILKNLAKNRGRYEAIIEAYETDERILEINDSIKNENYENIDSISHVVAAYHWRKRDSLRAVLNPAD